VVGGFKALVVGNFLGQPPALVIPLTRSLAMLTSRNSRLFRLLLSLVIRLSRLSAGRITLALRSWSASLWNSILTFARRTGRGQARIRLHANDVPVVDNNPIGELGPQISERARVEEEHSGTLAALPVQRTTRWQDEVSRYQALTSSITIEFAPLPATPEGGSQRYKPRTAM
jgi:hypothetical protein